MRYINLFLALSFLIFAVLQWNDPAEDRLFWILLYGLVALISALAAFRRYNVWSIFLGIGVVLFYLFRLFPAFILWLNSGAPTITGSMKAESPYIEQVREFLGLGISLAVLLLHFIHYLRINRQEKPFEEV